MAGNKFKALKQLEYGEISGLEMAWLGDFGAFPVEDATVVRGAGNLSRGATTVCQSI
jgi:hypothetical protein